MSRKYERDDLLRIISEKLYNVREVKLYLYKTKEIDKEDVRDIIANSENCKTIITFFPYDFSACIDDVINMIVLIANTERALMPCRRNNND